MDSLVRIALEGFHLCYLFVPNWGAAIVLFTIMIRVLLAPLQIVTTLQQAKLAAMKPKLDEIKSKFQKDVPRLLSERSKVLAAAGIRPGLMMLATFVQLPVFVGMYQAIGSIPDLSKVGLWWIPNLAAADPLFVLPVLVAFLIWLQSKASAPETKALVYAMPVLSFVFTAAMPAGVALYSLSSSAMQLIGQKVIQLYY